MKEQLYIPIQLLFNEIQYCDKCKLCKEKVNIEKGKTVGAGYIEAEIMIVGLASGSHREKESKDSKYGTPFNLFNEELYDGRDMEIARKVRENLEDTINTLNIPKKLVYITNLIKCACPDDREPEHDEVISCLYFLKNELEIIKPKIIITLGRFIADTLNVPINSVVYKGE